MTEEKRAEIREINHNYAIQAIRVLAFATKEHGDGSKATFADEENMTFLGLIGMIDPARKEAKDAIAVCKEAGIRAVMITGDFKDSAVAISDNLEMRDEKHMDAYSGEELDKISDDEKTELNTKIGTVRESIKGDDLGAINLAKEDLQKTVYAVSEKIYQKVKSGTLKGVSVGYKVDNFEEVGEGRKSSDMRFDGPCYVARHWTPYEVSIVSVPADPTVGVGRSDEDAVPEITPDLYETMMRQYQYNLNGGRWL